MANAPLERVEPMDVYIAVGTNQGNREENIARAMELILEIPGTEILKKSSFREYAAAEVSEGQAPFLNGVLEVRTELKPVDLLHKLQVIERKMGRENKGDGSSRVMDLDILSYGPDIFIQGKSLNIPHPRIQDRIFVLEPLVELDPAWKHPKSGKTAEELLRNLTSSADENHSVQPAASDVSQSFSS